MKPFNKIVLAAGTGQIGKALCKHFASKANKIIVLSRSQYKNYGNIEFHQWNGKTTGKWVDAINGAELLINLTGKNVNCRYTEANKKEIFDSRTDSVKALADALNLCHTKPHVWIQLASATIYRHAEDRSMDEINGENGEGFSVDVCKKWESTFMAETQQFS